MPGANPAVYSWLADSDLVDHVSFNGTVMTSTRRYDKMNRLTNTYSVASGGATVNHGYGYNGANQRTRVNLADGSYWLCGYDGRGGVRSGKRHWPDNSFVRGQQFEYTHDDIGNRTQTKVGGDVNGNNLRPASYTRDLLNRYSSRQVSTSVDVTGIANTQSGVSVTINNVGQSVYRRNEYFQALGGAGNSSSSPAWTPVSVSASRGGSTVQQPPNPPGHLLVPASNQTFTYDLDGNLTDDGVWTYGWDGENRLIKVTSKLPSGPAAQRLEFEYDWLGRRIRKTVYNQAVGGSIIADTKFLYDGWNLIAELSPQSSVLRSYLWGLDLSGTWQGAGGVGGLLEVNDVANGVQFPCYDGNGNVIALVNAAYGNATTRYEYGPFGELLRATGPMAALNHLRWSTKFTDDETDLVYYGYRYYSASLGRWLSRDPAQENGGPNLFSAFLNDAIAGFDSDGRGMFSIPSGGHNAPPVGAVGSTPVIPNAGPGDQTSAYSLGLQNLLGLTGNRTFRDNDKIAQQMKATPEAAKARQDLLAKLKAYGCRVGMNSAFNRTLGNQTVWRMATYFSWDFMPDMLLNPSRAYMGSYEGRVKVTKCICRCAVVQFELTDTKGWESASRVPHYGYLPLSDNSPRPALSEAPAYFIAGLVTKAVGTNQQPLSDFIPESIFHNDWIGPFGNTITVTITWQETLCPK